MINASITAHEAEELKRSLCKKDIILTQEIRKTLLGSVFLGQVQCTREEVVVKLSHESGLSKLKNTSCENPALETKALSSVPSHPNITIVKDSFQVSKTSVLVMEFMAGGDLFDYVNSRGSLLEKEARLYFVQILDALRHVHQYGYSHLDVSLENILLSQDRSIAKLCDFGQARTLQSFKSLTRTIRPGKILYMAPEIADNDSEVCGVSADLYSLGIVLFCMLVGFHPYTVPDKSDTAYMLLLDVGLEVLLEYYNITYCLHENCSCHEIGGVPHMLSCEAVSLLEGMLCKKNARLSSEEVARHSWLTY
jgi:serine/threonine protein kinase